MKEYTVLIQVIKVYSVTVEARSGAAAVRKVETMQSTDIVEQGVLKNVETDHAELVV